MSFNAYTSHPTLMKLILETSPESGTHETLSCNSPAYHVKFTSDEQFRFIKMGLEESPESGLLYRVEADSVLVVKPLSEIEAVVFSTDEPERYGIEVGEFILESKTSTPNNLRTEGGSIIRVEFKNNNEVHITSGTKADVTALARAMEHVSSRNGKVKFSQTVSPFEQNKAPFVATVIHGYDTPRSFFLTAEDYLRNILGVKTLGALQFKESKIDEGQTYDEEMEIIRKNKSAIITMFAKEITRNRKARRAGKKPKISFKRVATKFNLSPRGGMPLDYLAGLIILGALNFGGETQSAESTAKGIMKGFLGESKKDNHFVKEVPKLYELQMNKASVRNPLQKSDVGDKKKVVGGFRFRVGGSKRKPRKNIHKSIQSKRNARRGLAKRIRAVKKFHKSPQGKRLHRALGRFNATNRTNEHTESAMLFSSGNAYCEGKVYVWGLSETFKVQVVASHLDTEAWCKQYALHGVAYLSESELVLSTFNGLLNEKQEAQLVTELGAEGCNVSVYDDEPDYSTVEQAARLSRVISEGVKKRDGLWSIPEGYAIWLPSAGLHVVPDYQRLNFKPVIGESYASKNPAWLLRDSSNDKLLWKREAVIGTDEGYQDVSMKALSYFSDLREERFAAVFKPALKTKNGTISYLDIPVVEGVDSFDALFERQFNLTEDESGIIAPLDPFGVEDTLDDVFDDILAILVVQNYLDLLQDVEFDDEFGSIIMYFDPTATEEEISEILNGIDGENSGTSLIATPDGDMPNEVQGSDWWVVFIPGSEDAPVPNLESYEDGSVDTGSGGLHTDDGSVGKVVSKIDVQAAFNAASGK